MMAYDRYPAAAPRNRQLIAYVAVLIAAAFIIAGASAIWLSTDNSGTNSLATDPQSTSPPAAQ
jgi:hypothetical protein